MMKRTNVRPCYLSPKALGLRELPLPIRKLGRSLVASDGCSAFAAPIVVSFASELIQAVIQLPEWSAGSSTRYLIISDVPEQVLPKLLSALDLRRPDQRLHLTRDTGSIRRLLVSSARRESMLGIIDAYVWGDQLTIITGDFQFRAFPLRRIPLVAPLTAQEQIAFEISADGSGIHWPAGDIHLGVSQILQAADPMYLVDVAIERNGRDRTGAALRRLREERDLRQTDIPDLGERQVRRIEEGISRLRVESAEKFAGAFGMDLASLLDEIGRYAGELQPNSRGRSSRRGTQQQGDERTLEIDARV
jgi:transcriptional regulator with XRE-family HTH domain